VVALGEPGAALACWPAPEDGCATPISAIGKIHTQTRLPTVPIVAPSRPRASARASMGRWRIQRGGACEFVTYSDDAMVLELECSEPILSSRPVRAQAQRRTVSRQQHQAVPRVLKALRFDPSEVLAEVGVDARLFDDADNLIPDELVGRMLRHCSARTGCGDFALRVGRHARLASLGLVGALAGSSPDVGASCAR
jgi:hypothetical protein